MKTPLHWSLLSLFLDQVTHGKENRNTKFLGLQMDSHGHPLAVKCYISKQALPRVRGKLTLTGNLGDVMKESAVLALEYLKAHADLLDLDQDVFNNYNVHVHVPEGATPKDGPSAGITILTALASIFTQRRFKSKVAYDR